MNDSQEFDQLLTRCLRARPLPPAIPDLAARALEIARRHDAADLECRDRLVALNRRIRLLNAIAAMLLLAVVAVSLARIVRRDRLAAPLPSEPLAWTEAESAVEESSAEATSIAWVALWLVLGGSVLLAVERVMRSPADHSWIFEPAFS